MTGPYLVSPAGPCDPDALARTEAWWAAAGTPCRRAPRLNAGGALAFLSASDRDRAADLEAAWRDDSCDWILAVRGGCGSARLLELLDWDLLRSRNRLFGGYSDITALHWAMVRMGVGTPAVLPMALRWPELDGESRASALAALADLSEPGTLALEWLRPGEIRGLPLAGNLTVAASLAGTEYFPDCAGRVVLLEDVNEPAYKIDRCLLQLRLAGAFEHAAGVVFGRFTGGGAADAVREVLCNFADSVRCPTAAGFPFGHEFPLHALRFDRPLRFRS